MTNSAEMAQELDQKGFTVLRGLLSQDEANAYIERLDALSGFDREAARAENKGGLSKRGLSTSWYQPDGVTKQKDFWPLITNERLVETVQAIVDPDVRFLQHTDLHVGFSAISWHRDNINRDYGVGPDWDESEEPYKIVRVGIYLQTYEESSFRLGFIPGTHKYEGPADRRKKWVETQLKVLGALSYVNTSLQLRAPGAEWVTPEPGDCIIFDPRTIHSGSAITGPKYSMFLAYGKENSHFYNHQNYYRNIRKELNYQDIAPELVQNLQDSGLYQSEVPWYDEIEGAWVPLPIMQNLVKQRIR